LRLDRAGAPFLIDGIASGSTITQRFEVAADGLHEIRLDGRLASGTETVVTTARVLELDGQGQEIALVREARTEILPGQTECCVFQFSRIADARWRFFRMDMAIGDLKGRRLSLWAVPGPVNGRLTLNSHPQRAFLVFETTATEGTLLSRLRPSSITKTSMLIVLALLYNAGIAAIVHAMTIASDPRHA
jgi:hypothetical protein